MVSESSTPLEAADSDRVLFSGIFVKESTATSFDALVIASSFRLTSPAKLGDLDGNNFTFPFSDFVSGY